MVIDERKQEREIIIKLKRIGYSTDLDIFTDEILRDVKIICEQRMKPEEIKMTITIK